MTGSSNDRMRSAGRIALVMGAAALTALTWSAAQGQGGHEHGKDGDKGKQEEKAGGGHEGHGGKGQGGGHGKMGGHGMMQHASPGAVQQVCHGEGGHPPHYCEPMYKAVSSAPGVRVDDVDPAGERELIVKLGELNVLTPGIGQKLVIVAGGGDLAGAVVVEGGWKKEKSVNLKLNGTGSIYSERHLHLHVFPLTGS